MSSTRAVPPRRGGFALQPFRALAIVLLVAGCLDGPTQPVRTPIAVSSNPPGTPTADIADAAHDARNPHFYFLPPMVAEPAASGALDATLLPYVVVDVCAWSGTSCGSTTAHFTSGGKGSDAVRLDGDHYQVDWHTDRSLSSTLTYRLRVLVAGTELGHADVRFGRTASDLQGIDPTQYVAVVAGQTLPVKFRIEPGAVWVLGTSGGTFNAQAGAVSFAIPNGALSAPVGLTVMSPAPGDLPSDAASLAHAAPGSAWDFGPSGTTFATPATLTLRYDTSAVPKSVRPRALRLMFAQNGRWVAVPRSSVDPRAGTVTGQVAHFTPYGVSESAVVDSILTLQAQLDSLTQSSADVARAVQIELQLAALYQMSSAPEYQTEAGAFLQQATTTACTQYASVAGNAQVVVVANWNDLTTFVTPVLDWWALTQKLGATCDGAPDAMTLVEAKLAQFTTLYTTALQQSASSPDPCFGCLVQEYGRVVKLVASAQQLGLGPIATEITDQAQTPLAKRMRAGAYTNCQLRQRQTAPGLLLPTAGNGTPYSAADIQQDIEWCATSLAWELDRADATVKAKGSLGGTQPGALVTAAATSGLAAGTLVLKGSVAPLTCADGTPSAGEQLTIVEPTHALTLYSQALQPPAISSLLPAPAPIDVGQVVAALGIDPSQPGKIDLQVIHTSGGCGGFYGSASSYALATITLEYPTLTVTVSPASPRVSAGGTQQFAATVKGTTNQAVTWSATGGTIDNTGLYTAGQTPGTYQVKASSAQDTTVVDSTAVTVTTPLRVQSIQTIQCQPTDQETGITQLYAPLGPTPTPSLPFTYTQTQCGGQLTLGIAPVPGGAEFDLDVRGGWTNPDGFGTGRLFMLFTMDFPSAGQLVVDFNRGWATSYSVPSTMWSDLAMSLAAWAGGHTIGEVIGTSAFYGSAQYDWSQPGNDHFWDGVSWPPAAFPANGPVVLNVPAGTTQLRLIVGDAGSGTGRFATFAFVPSPSP